MTAKEEVAYRLIQRKEREARRLQEQRAPDLDLDPEPNDPRKNWVNPLSFETDVAVQNDGDKSSK